MSIITPVWAEDGDKTPAPSDEKIAIGWVSGDRPTTEYFNYILNRADNAANAGISLAAGVGVGNLYPTGIPAGAGADIMTMAGFHPDIGSGAWVVHNVGNSTTYFSTNNGYSWTAASDNLQDVRGVQNAIDSSNFLVCGAPGEIEVSSDGDNWTADTGPILAIFPSCLATKYPDDDLLVVGFLGGNIEIAALGAGAPGSYLAATSDPASLGDTDDLVRMKWLGSTNFFCLNDGGETFTSSDDADNWAVSTFAPADAATYLDTYSCMDYDAATTTLCVSGEDTGAQVVEFLYTTDNGATAWQAADTSGISVSSAITDMKHLGGLVWVACGDDALGYIFVSIDGGLSWHEGRFHTATLPTDIDAIYSNGSMIMVATDGQIFCSNAVPGLSNL